MSKIEIEVKTKITLELTAGEAGALAAICCYGPDIFLNWFKNTHGKSYIEPYQNNLRSLFTKARRLEHEVKKAEMAISELPKVINL